MLKASALYMVIVIALVIGLLCSSLIVAAYFYKAEYQKKFRYDRLSTNVTSGVNILLANTDSTYSKGKTFSLFDDDADSITLQRTPWGIYDVGIAKAFIGTDTLYKTFIMTNTIDSSKWAALYLMDEDRPFSLSGKTTIRGDVYIPKSGVQEAYIDGKSYQGDKRLIIGKRHLSDKKLPPLDENSLKQLQQYFNEDHSIGNNLLKSYSVYRSFLVSSILVNFKKEDQTLKNIKIGGNIILFSDTTITIDNTAVLNNTLVFARSIVVKSGFHGNCQLFAIDSIHVDSACLFDYSSSLGILRFAVTKSTSQAKISIDNSTNISGVIFTYEKADNPVKPLIVIGKNVTIKGQIYSQGALELKDQSEIDGSIFSSRFLYRSSFTLYENYLINSTIDSKALSPYYLTSNLIPVASKKKKVLQWLERN